MVLPTGLLLAGVIPSTAFTTAHDRWPGSQSDTLHSDTAATDTSLYNKQMQLGEVTVSAQRPLVTTKIDRVAYDIQHDEESKTKNVLEMLRKVPYVSVDGMDNITIKGSSNFKIYKNGHEDPAFSGQSVSQVLKSIPANTIKRIEVITDPGAREDAEGAKTILNIVTMDNSGLVGYTATLNTGIDWYGSHADGVNLITQIGKWTWSVNYTFFHDTPQSNKNHSESKTFFPSTGITQTTKQKDYSKNSGHFFDLSASYEIDSLNLLTFSGGGWYFNSKSRSYMTNIETDADGNNLYSYDQYQWNPGKSPAYYRLHGRLDFQHKTHLDGETLTASYMYSGSSNKTDQQNEFSNIQGENVPDYSGYFSHSKETADEHTFQLDYVRPLSKVFKIEAGGKYILRLNSSNTLMNYDGTTTLQDMTSRFKHNTQVGAAYAEATMNTGNWSAQAGVRYEFSYLYGKYPDGSAKSFHRSLNDWVPSASVQYKINEGNTMKASFSTSINRPGISYLNPARVETPTSISYGNAHLVSARFYNAGLEFTHFDKKLMLTFSPSYSWQNNDIGNIRTVENDKTVSTYANQEKGCTLGFNLYLRYSPWSKTTLSMNGSVYDNMLKNDNLGLENQAWYGYLFTSIQQKLFWKLNLYGAFFCSMGHPVSNVYGYGSNWINHYLSLSRTFLKNDRLSISITASNPFGNKWHDYQTRIFQGDYHSLQHYWINQRSISIRASIRLGSLKARVKTVDRSIENNDVIGGMQQAGGNKNGQQ